MPLELEMKKMTLELEMTLELITAKLIFVSFNKYILTVLINLVFFFDKFRLKFYGFRLITEIHILITKKSNNISLY